MLDEFMALPSTLPHFEVDLMGFNTEADAHGLWEWVRNYLDVFGRQMNLQKLHHLSIAYDYAGLLAKIDQGTNSGKILTATQDEFALGVAMAAPVLVDGVPRIHLALYAGTIAPLAEVDSPDHSLARYILAHECGHIHDLAMQDKTFPDVILRPHLSQREGILHGIAGACWSEYVACRLSARWSEDERTSRLESTFCAHLEGLRTRGTMALLEYQTDKNIGKLLDYLRGQYGAAMKYASYLLGHLRGLGLQLAESAPKAAALIEKKVFFKFEFERLVSCLDSMWESYGEWTGFEIFGPLQEVAEEILKVAGLTLETMPDGTLYIHVSQHVTYFSTEDE